MNPGPKTNSQAQPIKPVSISVCYECAFKQAWIMQLVTRGKDTSDVSSVCSDHADEKTH